MKVLAETNHYIVIEKPVNVPSQGDKTGDRDCLTMIKEFLKEKYQKLGNVYVGLVHRLDRPVGRCYGVCKNIKSSRKIK